MFHVAFIVLIHYPPKIVSTGDSPQQQGEGEVHLQVSAELLSQSSWDNVIRSPWVLYSVLYCVLYCTVSPSPRDTFHSPDTRPPFSRISPAERPGSSASLYREDMQTCGCGD